MLDTETKRRIDTARDILVGKIPDPKSQIEQITIALIYKFMDDMDKKAEELGGKSKFFSKDYTKYSWSKILDPSISGFEIVNVYGEAIQKMNQNPNLPQLFRDIFKNAYLPYRDPETLKSFLKIINEFKYDHSEKLGDAFEYLLSVMGSQGDAGQFRTPRHIIDFIVKVVDPSKDDTILDPACGTAGFLISAYKHILEKSIIEGKSSLTPDERKKLNNNIVGFDISPDMVRLSLVNLYLHNFKDPHIFEYDTLTSEEKWDDTFDVILANPPFMTPKGGIKPHKRFGVESNRSEVLFVDYIAEHLNNDGRAGIIVPEGIIFQSGNSYKKLRESLVKNSLYAVVSLPSGVFNPYSGVKTSILFLDKKIAKKTKDILFVKVESDGFGLGAQRREIAENDLPKAIQILEEYKKLINENRVTKNVYSISHIVSKEKIAKSEDYNLSTDRYREEKKYTGKFELVKIEDLICAVKYTNKIKTQDFRGAGRFPIIDQSEKLIAGYWDNVDDVFKSDTPVIIFGDHTRVFKYVDFDFVLGADGVRILKPIDRLNPKYFFYALKNLNIKNLGYSRHYKELKELKIPVPPLEVQEKIVEELNSYQNIIDGAKKIVENYRPFFKIEKEWKVLEVNELCTLVRGSSPRPQGDPRYYGGKVPRLMISDVTRDGMYSTPKKDFLTDAGARLSRPMKKGEVIMAVSGNPGLTTILATDACIHDGFVGFKNLSKDILPEFLYFVLSYNKDFNNSKSIGAVFKNLTTEQIKEFKIPVPPIRVQEKIVSMIESEQKLINLNKSLIELFEKKIIAKLAEVWGE